MNVHHLKTDTTEKDILKLKELDHEGKIIKAHYDKIKKRLIEGYFQTNEEFIGTEGLILATYKTQKRISFHQELFKADYPSLFNIYAKEQLMNVFLLKK